MVDAKAQLFIKDIDQVMLANKNVEGTKQLLAKSKPILLNSNQFWTTKSSLTKPDLPWNISPNLLKK